MITYWDKNANCQ